MRQDHFHCKTCNRFFQFQHSLKDHYTQSRKHEYCQGCDVHFDNTDDLLDHGEEQHFVCWSCEKVHSISSLHLYFTNTLSAAVFHSGKIHNPYAPGSFPCKTCDRFFQFQHSLKDHYTQSRKHEYCQGCDMHFDNTDDLLDHGKEDHFVCRSCKKV